MTKIVRETASREETVKFGGEVSQLIKEGRVIAFFGDLGAGKTSFVEGFARGFGFDGEISSPTFSLVNEYRGGKIDIFHFDMYRISGWEDLYSTGYFDYIDEGGVLLVEWSENIEAALPDDAIKITIEKLSDDKRRITVEMEKEKC